MRPRDGRVGARRGAEQIEGSAVVQGLDAAGIRLRRRHRGSAFGATRRTDRRVGKLLRFKINQRKKNEGDDMIGHEIMTKEKKLD